MESFEQEIINNASSTLAGIKPASLFNYTFTSESESEHTLTKMNRLLNPKGVYLEAVKRKGNFFLIYLYRRTALEKLITTAETQDFLRELGFAKDFTIEDSLVFMKKELSQSGCFPHEIGVFLGYPVSDIKAFIENKGKNYKLCGIWKVYCNEAECLKFFTKVEKCRSVYLRVFQEGRNLYDLTVSA